MTDDAVWVRAAIDTSDPRWPDPESGTVIGRNPFEDANAIAGRVDTTLDVGRNTVRFFLYKTLAPSGAVLEAQAEQLTAMWYSVNVYRGLSTPGSKRVRMALVALDGDLVLAIPDQGYLPLGSPSPALWSALSSVDAHRVLDTGGLSPEGSDFSVFDVALGGAP